MVKLADWMKQVADICVKIGDDEDALQLDKVQKELKPIHEEVKKLALKFPLPAIGK